MTLIQNPLGPNPVGVSDRRAQMQRWIPGALPALVAMMLITGPATAQTPDEEKTSRSW